MGTTVIDRLVVELGLDPRQFKTGTQQANAAVKQTTTSVTKGASEMVSSLHRVAVEFGSLFLAVRSFKDVVGYMKDLQDSTRQLGYDAKNTGESAADLKVLGNAAEIVGGKADDATASVLNLQKSIFNARHGLGWSDQLTEFNRLGVDTGVNRDKPRPELEILRDVAKALEQQYPDRAQRYQETQVLGLQGGIGQLVANGLKEFDRQIALQRSIPQVTQGQTNASQRLHESYDVLTQRIEAIMRQVLTAVEPALEKLFKGIGDYLQKHTKDISGGIETLLGWFSGDGPQKVVDSLVAMGDAAAGVVGLLTGRGKKGRFAKGGTMESIFGDKPFFSGEQTDAEKANGLPIGTIDRLKLNHRDNTTSFADTAAELKALHDSLGGDKGDPDYRKAGDAFRSQYGMQPLPKGVWEQQGDWFKGLMKDARDAADARSATQGAESSPAARAIIDNSKPTADTGTRGGGSVTLQVDTLNVNGVNTNSVDSVAAGVTGGLQRRLAANFADGALS